MLLLDVFASVCAIISAEQTSLKYIATTVIPMTSGAKIPE
jgi:hypothetical protein